MVLAYTDKVTGVYEKASPTKDSPTSVTISGKEYSVESVDAFNALSSSGTFKYGDTVTLLLGRNGEAAGVVGGSESTSSHTTVGFVTETGKKISQTLIIRYIQVTMQRLLHLTEQ